jgi:hypothetical protein
MSTPHRSNDAMAVPLAHNPIAATPTRRPLLDLSELERAHLSNAQAAFFRAWKQGAALAGAQYFGGGTQSDLDQAARAWDLQPNLQRISDSISVMSGNEKAFLAALVSIYNSQDGGRLLQRVGVHGLADLGGLDLSRRTVIAALILHYTPSW